MKKPLHKTARLAARLQASLQSGAQNRVGVLDGGLAVLCLRLESIARLRRELTLCSARGLHLAAGRVLGQISNCLQNLAVELQSCGAALREAAKPLPSLRSMCEELHELELEFDEVRFDREHGSLSAATEPIELEGTALGRFELHLLLEPLAKGGGRNPLRVIALDPNPAASNEAATHPHVSDEVLCAGYAACAMQAALNDGRICDFFLLVRSVLCTHNAVSAYVSLDNWNGRPCHECGRTVDEDDILWCEGCEEGFCDDCFSYCTSCDTSRCHTCLGSCVPCKETCCESCLGPCGRCGEVCCPGCLEDGLCPNCKEEQEDPDEDKHQEQHESNKPEPDRCPEPVGAASQAGRNNAAVS